MTDRKWVPPALFAKTCHVHRAATNPRGFKTRLMESMTRRENREDLAEALALPTRKQVEKILGIRK